MSSGFIPVAAGVGTSFLSKAESRRTVWTTSRLSITLQWAPGLFPTILAVEIDAAVNVSVQITCSSGVAGSRGDWISKSSVSILEGPLRYFLCLLVSRRASHSVSEPPWPG